MTRISMVLFALLGAVLSSASALADGAQFGPPPDAKLSVEKLAAIDDFINGEVESGRIPGAIVLIRPHGEQIYFKCFGKRDPDTGAPMTPDPTFPIHAATKTIPSVTALMPAARGPIR